MIGQISFPASGLEQSQNSLTKSLNRLSSGSRINSAKDDAAGLAIATAMAAQLGSNNQAQRNVNDGLSVMETAGGALSQVSESLQRMRELSVQAANGTNSASDRQAIQAEISQLGQGIEQIVGNSQFNGQNLFDGNFSAQLQVGPNAGDTSQLALGNASASSLGINELDATSQSGAASAIQAIDGAISTVSSMQGAIGAAQANLSSTSVSLANTYEKLASSRSRITDTDYASESGNLTQSNVRQQAAVRALALYNANQANVLSLLPGKS